MNFTSLKIQALKFVNWHIEQVKIYVQYVDFTWLKWNQVIQ